MKQEFLLPTSDERENEEREKKVMETENFILTRMLFLKGFDRYEIIDQKTFERLMDELSLAGCKQECNSDLKQELFMECSKELRGGVKVKNMAKLVAEMIHSQKIESQKRQKLEKIFTGNQDYSQQKHKKKSFKDFLLFFTCGSTLKLIHDQKVMEDSILIQKLAQNVSDNAQIPIKPLSILPGQNSFGNAFHTPKNNHLPNLGMAPDEPPGITENDLSFFQSVFGRLQNFQTYLQNMCQSLYLEAGQLFVKVGLKSETPKPSFGEELSLLEIELFQRYFEKNTIDLILPKKVETIQGNYSVSPNLLMAVGLGIAVWFLKDEKKKKNDRFWY